MGLMEVASGKSVYRGYEYYIHNKVFFAEKVDEYQYRGAVEGTADEPYKSFDRGCRSSGEDPTVTALMRTAKGSYASIRSRYIKAFP